MICFACALWTPGSDGHVPQTSGKATVSARDLFYSAMDVSDKGVPDRDKLPELDSSRTGATLSRKPQSAELAIAGVDHFGVRYNVLMIDKASNQAQAVDPDRTFHTGECLALEVEANRAGYLYIISKNSNGNWDALFPSPQMQDESEIVQGGMKQRVPQNYCFELDKEVGEEHLFLILSRNPKEIYDLHAALRKRNAASQRPSGSKDSAASIVAEAHNFNRQANDEVRQLARRGFTITKVSRPESGEQRYSVYIVPAELEKKDTVFAEIRIKHE